MSSKCYFPWGKFAALLWSFKRIFYLILFFYATLCFFVDKPGRFVSSMSSLLICRLSSVTTFSLSESLSSESLVLSLKSTGGNSKSSQTSFSWSTCRNCAMFVHDSPLQWLYLWYFLSPLQVLLIFLIKSTGGNIIVNKNVQPLIDGISMVVTFFPSQPLKKFFRQKCSKYFSLQN